jgi:hypothetical protein
MVEKLKEGKSVIIIDGDKGEESKRAFKEAAGGATFMEFTDWNARNFQDLSLKLRELKTLEKVAVVYTDMDGARGVDFAMKKLVHVILAFEPKGTTEITQALGRGSRSVDGCCEGTVVAPSNHVKGYDNVGDYLSSFS